VTQTGMGSAQGLNAAWLTSRMEEHKRPVALAAYAMSLQLAGFPGNQLFRAQGKQKPVFSANQAHSCSDAPRYRYGLIIAASCTIAGAVVIWIWKLLYRTVDRRIEGVEPTADREAAAAAVTSKV